MARHPAETRSAALYPLLLFLIVSGIAILFGIAGFQASSRASALEGKVLTTEAAVLETEVRSRRENGQLTRRYYVRYRYEPFGFAPVTRESEVSLSFYSKIEARRSGGITTLPVTYAAAAPEIAEIEPGAHRKKGRSLFVISAIAGILSLPVLACVLKRIRRTLRDTRS